ncbi:hypothetical protein [Spirosoma flavum]|uniref:Uncharacterized protein n=1 Tax=Spirosoma flavum TaxID=2048557 RepID=A0ABW6AI26_9BACT
MKLLLMSLLLSIGMLTIAQKAVASNLRTRISDDEKALSIQVDGNANGHKIHLDKTFDVANMNSLQKDLLKYQVFNDAGLTAPLSEIPWLILVILGLPALIITLLIVRYQTRKRALVGSMQRL